MNSSEIPHIVDRPASYGNLKTDLNNLEVVSMEGAGVTGVLYTGALKALYEEGMLNKVKKFAGTSSGSIVATGAALGYRGEELEKIALNQDFRNFCRSKELWSRQLLRNLNRDGIYSGREMNRWIGGLCAKRIGNKELTFGDLIEYRKQAEAGNRAFFDEKYDAAMAKKSDYKKTAVVASAGKKNEQYRFDFEMKSKEESITKMIEIAKGFRELEVAATEITDDVWLGKESEKAVTFNGNTAPKLKISDGVRASASYPFIFRHAKLVHDGKERFYTDGGFTTMIPTPLRNQDGSLSRNFLGLVSDYIIPDKTPEDVTKEKQESGYLYNLMEDMKGQVKIIIKKAIAWQFGAKVLSHLKDENYTSTNHPTKISMSLKRGLNRMRKDMLRFTEMGDVLRNSPEMTGFIIPLNRKGVLGTNFDIMDDEKADLIDSAYHTMKFAISKFKQENKGLIGGVKPMEGRAKPRGNDSFSIEK